jgi:carbamoyltransferase
MPWPFVFQTDESMNVIGISAYFHNSACCLLQNGSLIAAAQEESFTRVKHDPVLPKHSLRYCLEEGGITLADVDILAYYEDPTLKLARQIWTYGPGLPCNRALLGKLDALRPEREIRELLGYEGKIEIVTHHQAHAASSYYWSGFPESAVMTVDGVGEWATTTYGVGRGQDLEIFEEVQFPDSLGLLYSTITNFLGFSVNEGEYKVMGLAPYGKPTCVNEVRKLIAVGEAGQFRLNLQYFDFTRTDRMYSDQLAELFGHGPRCKGSEITEFHRNLARSLQCVLESVLVEKANYIYEKTGSTNLCMAGGVALNCVANSRVLRETPFQKLFVQPAANDAGGALGAAAIAHRKACGRATDGRPLDHVYFGPSYTSAAVLKLLQSSGLAFKNCVGREEALIAATVNALTSGKVVGWFQGRMEFGPRALGARSILADPREPDMRDRINALVKKREEFRPFAPAVLASKTQFHFQIDHPSPFMLETCQVCSPLSLPAITHVDGSARVQTVDGVANPRFAHLLEAFEDQTGCPILLNTSFNMKDEPIVCSPVDALLCFVRSQIDVLVIEDFFIERESLPASWSVLFQQAAEPTVKGISHEVYTFV